MSCKALQSDITPLPPAPVLRVFVGLSEKHSLHSRHYFIGNSYMSVLVVTQDVLSSMARICCLM
jgi:hypothetical protein